MIDIKKTYTYRNGEPARVLCVDAYGVRPVISLDKIGRLLRHYEDGTLTSDFQLPDRDAEYDLIEVKEKRTLEFWVNIYNNGIWTNYASKEEADESARGLRIACKHVVIEYFDGEGL